jgi:hypothetical protein
MVKSDQQAGKPGVSRAHEQSQKSWWQKREKINEWPAECVDSSLWELIQFMSLNRVQ